MEDLLVYDELVSFPAVILSSIFLARLQNIDYFTQPYGGYSTIAVC